MIAEEYEKDLQKRNDEADAKIAQLTAELDIIRNIAIINLIMIWRSNPSNDYNLTNPVIVRDLATKIAAAETIKLIEIANNGGQL